MATHGDRSRGSTKSLNQHFSARGIVGCTFDSRCLLLFEVKILKVNNRINRKKLYL